MSVEMVTRRDRLGSITEQLMRQGNQSPGARLAEMKQFAGKSGAKMNLAQALRFIKQQRAAMIPSKGDIPGQTARSFPAVQAPPTGRIPTMKPQIARARPGAKKGKKITPAMRRKILVARTLRQLVCLFTGKSAKVVAAQNPRAQSLLVEIAKRGNQRLTQKQFPAITVEDVQALYKSLVG